MIQAACAGDLNILKRLKENGCKLTEVGHICLSPKRHNSVLSNVLGAAAYYGNREVLQLALSILPQTYVNVMAIETQDRLSGKAGPFVPEL